MAPVNTREEKRRHPQSPLDRLKSLLETPGYWAHWAAEMERFDEERAAKRKDAILHIRINSRDLAKLKEKAARAGLKYQTYIGEFLRRAVLEPKRTGRGQSK